MAGGRNLFSLFGVIGMRGLDTVERGLTSVDRGAQRTANTVRNSSQVIERAGLAVAAGWTAALTTAAAAATKFINSASDLNETIGASEQIFGASAEAIDDWSDTAASRLGQTKQAAIDAANNFGVFGKAAGLADNDLVKFSTDLVELATDFASFKNTTPEEAVTAIGAALRGESEPIRNYGILLNDAVLRQQALRLGLIKTTKEALTPQNKVLAAQAEIYRQSTDIQGDFSRTSKGLANQQRILAAQVEDLSAALGESLLPIATDLITVVNNDLVPTIRKVAEWFNELSPRAKKLGLALTNPFFFFITNIKRIFNEFIIQNKVFALRISQGISQINIAIAESMSSVNNWIGELSSLIPGLGDKLVVVGKKWSVVAAQERMANAVREESIAKLKEQSQGFLGLKDATEESSKETDKNTKKVKSNTNEIDKNAEALKKAAEKKAKFEKMWSDKLFESTATQLQLLNKQEKEAIAQAKKIGASTTSIVEFYKGERERLQQEENQKRVDSQNEREAKMLADMAQWEQERLEVERAARDQSLLEAEEAARKKEELQRNLVDTTINAINTLFSIINDYYSFEIEREEQKRKEQIKSVKFSVMTEEQKASAINKINADSDEKITALKRKQAKADKANAIFQIIINTATAIMSAFAQLGPIAGGIFSVIIGALGIAQIALVAARPIPFAQGGLVKSRPSKGVNAIIGEGREDEVVFPLKTGVDLMYNKLMDRVSSTQPSSSPLIQTFSPQPQDMSEGPLHVHIGTLIADDASYLELERKLRDARSSESQRRGFNGALPEQV